MLMLQFTIYTPHPVHRVWGMDMEDFGVLWVWGFCGDSHKFFCGYRMGVWIESQSHDSPVIFTTRRIILYAVAWFGVCQLAHNQPV